MIENDKANWRNALFSSIAVTIGSFLIQAVYNPRGNPFPFDTWIMIQPFAWLFVFSPVLFIELISRIQRGINGKRLALDNEKTGT